jgi:hypothetical protein
MVSQRTFACSACNEVRAAANFTKMQLNKSADKRRCRHCVELEKPSRWDVQNSVDGSGGGGSGEQRASAATDRSNATSTTAIDAAAAAARDFQLQQINRLALCKSCGKPGADKTCTGCRSVKYCDVECQREDWRSGGHKNACALLRPTAPEELPAQLSHAAHPGHTLVQVSGVCTS